MAAQTALRQLAAGDSARNQKPEIPDKLKKHKENQQNNKKPVVFCGFSGISGISGLGQSPNRSLSQFLPRPEIPEIAEKLEKH